MEMTTRRGKGEKLNWDEMDDNLERVAIIYQKSNIVPSDRFLKGITKLNFVNGSPSITGKNFLDESIPTGFGYWYAFFVEVNEIIYYCSINSIESDTIATLQFTKGFDNETGQYSNDLGDNWPFASGEYNVFFSKTVIFNQADNCVVNGINNNVIGTQDEIIIYGNENTSENAVNASILGNRNIVRGANNICNGLSNKIEGIGQNRNNVLASSFCTLKPNGSNNSLINSYSSTLGGNTSVLNSVTAIGFLNEQLDFTLLSNCVVVPRLLVYEIPVFESDALAAAGGLIAGMAYRNAAGQGFYKLP